MFSRGIIMMHSLEMIKQIFSHHCIYKNLFKTCKIKVNKLILNITEPILVA